MRLTLISSTAQSTTDLDQAPPTGSQIGSKTTTALPAITYGEASVLEVDQSTQNERGPRDSLPSILNETGNLVQIHHGGSLTKML